MRSSLTKSVDEYIKTLKNFTWVFNESYKFEFANYINKNVDWNSQNDEEIVKILIQSQKIVYTSKARGIQFILKSGREKLSEFINQNDVQLFRQIHDRKPFEEVNWSNRGMSFTGLSGWLSSLFPKSFYPVPLIGLNETIKFLFDTDNSKFPKIGKKYLLACQPYMKETESILKQYPVEENYLAEWNTFYKSNPELNVEIKTSFSKVDWVWLVQDFHLFVHRKILGLYNKKPKEIKIKEDIEPMAVEGNSKLSTHLRYERNSGMIKKIKRQALEENKMLNCEVCGFSFLNVYGEIGEGFIEAHHKNPLSERGGEVITQKDDIALVCSNCHRMLHRGDPIFSVEKLKEMMKKN